VTNKFYIEGTHGIIGATGGYGNALAMDLNEAGNHVVAIVRNRHKAENILPGDIEIRESDILNQEDVKESLKGVNFIYVGFNFSYGSWDKYYEAIDGVIKAAVSNKSTIIFPGNVYGYGKFSYIPVDENHPLNSKGKKGKIRNEIEKMLIDQAKSGKIKLILPRFADFYGPNVTNALYGAMFYNAIENKKPLWPINADVPHMFTYIKDASRATLMLVSKGITDGGVYHISGNQITAREFIKMIFGELNRKERIKVVSETTLKFLSFFNSDIRELKELFYEYSEPYILSDSKFRAVFNNFEYTPYEIGIRETLDWFHKHVS
jgi:nucleoside-diphosphate-sugar epimerase